MVASGIMDETGQSMIRMLEAGAGAVVTKSIGSEPRPGHANPCFTEVEGGLVNAMGLPNPGIDEFGEEMKVAVPRGKIVGSIYGASAKEFAALAAKMEEYGACAVEMNLSCPHAKGYGMELGTDPEIVKEISSAVSSTVSIPVWAKLTPNTHILTQIAKAAEDGGCEAVVAINTLKAMVITPEMGKPFLSNRFGGLSGRETRRRQGGLRPLRFHLHTHRRSRRDIHLEGRRAVHHGRSIGVSDRFGGRRDGARGVRNDQRRPRQVHGRVRLRFHRGHEGDSA